MCIRPVIIIINHRCHHYHHHHQYQYIFWDDDDDDSGVNPWFFSILSLSLWYVSGIPIYIWSFWCKIFSHFFLYNWPLMRDTAKDDGFMFVFYFVFCFKIQNKKNSWWWWLWWWSHQKQFLKRLAYLILKKNHQHHPWTE